MFIPTHLVDYLIHSANLFPEKCAVMADNKKYTYHYLHEVSNQVANALIARGLQRNDRVIVCLPNCIEAIILFWAILKANAIVSVVNPGISLQKLNYIIEDAAPKFVFMKNETGLKSEKIILIGTPNSVIWIDAEWCTDSWLLASDSKMPFRKTIDIDLAAIVYTSGSTGTPKGVMLTHRNMLTASISIHNYLNLNKNDVIISALSLSFDYGLYQMILTILNGATLILEKDFTWPIQFIKKIAEEKVTIFPGVPMMFSILSNHLPKMTYELDSVRSVTNTGAALLERHIHIIKKLFPSAAIFSMYGLTECKRCTYLPPEDIFRKPRSVGRAIPNTEMWVIDELGNPLSANQIGQLVVRGATVMQGYWNKPIESEKALKKDKLGEEKILYTGDYGYIDEEGYFYHHSRIDETIKRYGEKVSLIEIENTIYLLPEVSEVAAIALPDSMFGATIIVFVSSLDDPRILKEKILLHCKMNLAKTHWPQEIVVRKELPKNSNGKLDKACLKNQFIETSTA